MFSIHDWLKYTDCVPVPQYNNIMLCYLNNTEDHIVGFSTYFTKATASIRNEQSMDKQLLSIKMYVFYF